MRTQVTCSHLDANIVDVVSFIEDDHALLFQFTGHHLGHLHTLVGVQTLAFGQEGCYDAAVPFPFAPRSLHCTRCQFAGQVKHNGDAPLGPACTDSCKR